MTPTSVVPPPMSTTIDPIGSATGSPAPIAAAIGSSISDTRSAPALLTDAGFDCLDTEGIAWSPTRGLHLSDDLRLNYLIAAAPAGHSVGRD